MSPPLMSHRFVRCPHCKMPHDAAERVCPNTGLHMPVEARPPTREGRRAEVRRSLMSELPPPERRPEPMAFDPQRDRVGPERKPNPRSGEIPGTLPPTRDLQRDLLGQTVGGRYLIKGVLGEGGMGTVYDAEHLGLSRHVAIKVLSPAQAKKRVAVKRFQQEARAAGAIGHPNICEVYDLGLLDDGSPYLVMEKLVGQTLADRIAKEGGLPFDEVVEVMVQVLSGLVAAHEKGIIHRDIKPENIFLARRVGCPPIIKLLDFGVSKMMPEFQTGEDSLDLTRTGMVMGTPYYMSPEQARGERNLDGRVDVYACGVVMYEALAGKRPFLAPNYNALLLAIINTTPRPLRELRPKTPPELEAIIMKAMAKNRADRFLSAKHFLHELAPPAAEGSAARLPAPPTPEERKRAPVLGGGRTPGRRRSEPPPAGASSRGRRHEPPPQVARPYHEPSERPDGPSATLRSRMADPAGRGADRERATRVDVRPKLIPAPYDAAAPRRPSQPPPPPPPIDDSDDIDIPIHVVAEEDVEEPTEIFRPGVHLMPRQRTRTPVSNRGSSARGHAHPQEPRPKRMSSRPPPRAALPDDWDGETVVKRPDFGPHIDPRASMDRPRQRSADPRPSARRREPRAFNPDETMKLDNTGEVELIDERHAPPRRR